MIVDTESRPKSEVYCTRKRCAKFLGEVVEEGQAIEIGNAKVWHTVTLCCVHCNRPFRFEPINIPKGFYDSLDDEKEI